MKTTISIAVLAGIVMIAQAEIKEIQINGSFESLDSKNVPVKWINNPCFKETGKIAVLTEGAQEGKNCVEIKTSATEFVHFYNNTSIKVKPGDKVKISYYVKGTGRIGASAYAYSSKGKYLGGLAPAEETVEANDWTLKEVSLEIPDKEYAGNEKIGNIRLLFSIGNTGALQIDNARIAIDIPASN